MSRSSNFKENLKKFGTIDYDMKSMNFSGQIFANTIIASSFSSGNGSSSSSTLPPISTVDIKGNVVGNSVRTNVVTSDMFTAQYLIGNGSQLSGIASGVPTRANINILGNVVAPGNVVVGGQVDVIGNVTAQYFIGDGSLISGIQFTLPSNANVDIVGNVNAPGNVSVDGQVKVLGNAIARYVLGNGSQLTGVFKYLPTSGNFDIVGNVSAPGNVNVAGQVNVFGNVIAQYFIGNGSQLTDVTATLPASASSDIIGNVVSSGNVDVGGQVQAIGNVTASYLIGNGSQLIGVVPTLTSANIDIVGNVFAPGNVNVTGQVIVNGNVTAGYFIGNGSRLTGVLTALPPNANLDIIGNVIAPGNVNVAGQVNVLGNVTASYFFGNGALLTNVNSTLPTNANTNIVGNVIAPGNIVVNGQVNVAGNVVAGYFIGNGSQLSGVLTALPSAANIDILGNVSSRGNVNASGQVNVIGNLSAQYFIGNGSLLSGVVISFPSNANLDITGNVNAPGNITVTGQVNVVGNVIGGYFIGNGSLLTGLNTILPSTLQRDVVGNINASGNVSVIGQINVVGNVTAINFLGNGSQLTGILNSIPTSASVDINGNVIGGYANVTNVISSRGNIANVVLLNSNVSGQFLSGNGAFLSGVLQSFPSTACVDVLANTVVSTSIVANALIVNNTNMTSSLNVFGNVSAGYFIGNAANISLSGLLLNPGANVANQAVRLALSNIPNGTLVLQSDTQVRYLLLSQPPSTSSNWLVFSGASFAVSSVFGRSGSVVAQVGDYNASFVQTTSQVGTIVVGQQLQQALGYLDTFKANITLGNIAATFRGNVLGNVVASNVSASTLIVNGNANGNVGMNIVGNVTSNYFVGNGIFVTGVTTGLPSVANIDVVGNVTTPGNGNIVVTGYLALAGNMTAGTLVVGNVVANSVNVLTCTSNVLSFETGNITGNSNVIASFFNANNMLISGNVFGTMISNSIVVYGNVDAANVTVSRSFIVSGNVIASGNIVGQDALILGNVIVSGNVIFGNNVYLQTLSNVGVSNASYSSLVLDVRTNSIVENTANSVSFGSNKVFVNQEGLILNSAGSLYSCGVGGISATPQIFSYSNENRILQPITGLGGPSARIIDFQYSPYNAIALTSNGDVWSWGYTYTNPVNNQSYVPYKISLPGPARAVFMPKMRQIIVGNQMSQFAAILSNGQMYMWGLNQSYQLGDGTTTTRIFTPQVPSGIIANENVIKVEMNTTWDGSTYALTGNGRLFRWGNNSVGQLGFGNTNIIPVPVLQLPLNVVDVVSCGAVSPATGQNFSSARVLLGNGASFGTGTNTHGELSFGNINAVNIIFTRENTNRSNIAAIGSLSDISNNAHYIIQNDGQILFSGSTYLFNSQPGAANSTFQLISGGFQKNMLGNVGNPIVTPQIKNWWTQSGYGALVYWYGAGLLDNTGNMYYLGYNTQGVLGNGSTTANANVYPFTLVNTNFPNPNVRVADFAIVGNSYTSGGMVLSCTDGTMLCSGNASSGTIPNAIQAFNGFTTSSAVTTYPYFSYVPGYNPLNVL